MSQGGGVGHSEPNQHLSINQQVFPECLVPLGSSDRPILFTAIFWHLAVTDTCPINDTEFMILHSNNKIEKII